MENILNAVYIVYMSYKGDAKGLAPRNMVLILINRCYELTNAAKVRFFGLPLQYLLFLFWKENLNAYSLFFGVKMIGRITLLIKEDMTMVYIIGSKGNYSRGRKSELSRIIEKLVLK